MFNGNWLSSQIKTKPLRHPWAFLWILLVFLLVNACGSKLNPSPVPSDTPPLLASPTDTEIPSTSTLVPSITSTRIPEEVGTLPVWQHYAAPTLPAVTDIPAPLTSLNLPDEVKAAILIGSDEDLPFVGRTDSLTLVLYNARLSKASLISIPPSLFVYIPGYTMQRIGVAYAVVGLDGLKQTLAYNLGITPDHWILVHPKDFVTLVNTFGGIDVPVLLPMPDVCNGITNGTIHMNGDQALCYVRFIKDLDEIDRNRRQQQILRLLFLRLVTGGNMAQMPVLYSGLKNQILTDLGLNDLNSGIPLALKLSDPQRISYFQIGWDETNSWQLPGKAKTSVLLPKNNSLLDLVQHAVDAVMLPAPLSDRVSTLIVELTSSPSPTLTPLPSLTFTITPTSFKSPTITFTPTITRTPTITLTPTISLTPTITMTYTAGPSPTGTLTSTETLTPTEGPSPTTTLTQTVTPTQTETLTSTP